MSVSQSSAKIIFSCCFGCCETEAIPSIPRIFIEFAVIHSRTAGILQRHPACESKDLWTIN